MTSLLPVNKEIHKGIAFGMCQPLSGDAGLVEFPKAHSHTAVAAAFSCLLL